MFDDKLIRQDSLENTSQNGKVTGFRFAIRPGNGRGTYLSLIGGFYVAVDKTEYGHKVQRLAVNGREPRSIDELRSCSQEYWNLADEACLYIEMEGGLTAGKHRIDFQECLLSGYFKASESWITNPPRPGTGGKISTFHCILKNKEE